MSFKAARADHQAASAPLCLVSRAAVGQGQRHANAGAVTARSRDVMPIQVQGHILVEALVVIAYRILQQLQGRFPGLRVLCIARVGVGVAVVPEVTGLAALGDGGLHGQAAFAAGKSGLVNLGMLTLIVAVQAGVAGVAVGILIDMGILIGAALDYFNIGHPADASFHNDIGRSVFARYICKREGIVPVAQQGGVIEGRALNSSVDATIAAAGEGDL